MRDDALFSIAIERDQHDLLRDFGAHFELPPDIIYMDGNSLGALPKATRSRVDHAVLNQWGRRLIQSWNESWMELPGRIGGKIATLIGADPDEILVCDSTSVNFYKLVEAAKKLQLGRSVAVTERMGFPTNNYILQGAFEEENLRYVESIDDVHMPPEDVEAHLNEAVSLLCLNHVNFRSGWLHDMGRLTASAKREGILTLWDLSHSVGAVPIDLHEANADLAVGCTYKYLNGGPGAPAFLYVRRELQKSLSSPIQGWFGRDSFFNFADTYEPAGDIRRFNAGTPNILSMVAVEPGLDLVLEAGIQRIRDKSIQLTEFFLDVYDEKLKKIGVRLNTPRNPGQRGSHVSLGHDRALEIDSALIKRMGVIPDFRGPDNIRFGVSPLYNKFGEVYEALDRMRLVLENKSYEAFDSSLGFVT